ncbi:hypothetical protein TKK_0016489 [Trichogramma kaykai]
MVMSINNKVIPLMQILTERHDTNRLKLFLMDAVHLGAPIPHETRCAGSLALLNALSLAFNKCNYSEYQNHCVKVLKNEVPCVKPCFIRSDEAHVIKSACRWKCFLKKDSRVKDLYVRCISYAMEIKCFNELLKLIETIFIISNTKSIEENSTCEIVVEDMKNKLKTFTYEDENDNENDNPFTKEEFSEVVRGDIKTILDNIYNKVENSCRTKELNVELKPNVYYCPKIKDNILYLFAQFASWTNIMVPFYNTKNPQATSAICEEYFKDRKHNDTLCYPVNANKFFLQNLKTTDALTTAAKAFLIRQTKTKVVERKKITIKNYTKNELIVSRNKRRNEIIHTSLKKIKTDNFVQLNQRSLVYNKDSIIQNGNSCDPVMCNGILVKLSNTCAFDSFTEIMSKALKTFGIGMLYLQAKLENNYLKVVSDFIQSMDFDQFYKNRANILYPLGKRSASGVDCRYNIITLIEDLLPSNDNALLTKYKDCLTCNKEYTPSYFNVLSVSPDEVHHIFMDGAIQLQNIQLLIDSVFTGKFTNCSNCNTYRKISSYAVNQILIIDLESIFISFDNDEVKSSNQECPKNLIIMEEKYKLVGIVRIIPGEPIGHYIAYIYDYENKQWLERDDTHEEENILQEFDKQNKNCCPY